VERVLHHWIKWQAADKLGMEDVRGAAESEEIVATGGYRCDVGDY
jgi:hypothetical protein